MKRCSKCGRSKPLDQFYVKKGRGGRPSLQGYCKPCNLRQQRELRARKAAEREGELDLSYDRDNREHEMPPAHPLEEELCERAACSGLSHLFIKPRKFEARTGLPDKCKSICQQCPVFAQCRTFIDYLEDSAVTLELVAGYWAGETPRERTERRKHARVRPSSAAA